jgi:acyl-[acyl-carrier-protein]-phospholipid O-acyltransferase/long-chain-fatty-acid--[acyl-carrier-protein] ligase
MLLHQRFVHTAKRFRTKLAFIDRTLDRRITYSQALIASLIFTNKFRRYDPGFIGIMLPTSAGAALSVLATLMSGRIPAMINYSTGAKKNAEYAQKKCNFSTIVTSKALLEKVDCPRIDGMIFIENMMAGITTGDRLLAAMKAQLPAAALLKLIHSDEDNSDSVILFTSGSEKDPKAVQLSHRNITSNIEGYSEAFGISSEDRMLVSLPFFHVFGLTTSLWTPLHHGMTLVTYANPLEYKTISNIVREEKPTMMVGTPAFFRGYLDKSQPGDYASIRLAVCGADKCPDALREGFIKKHNVILYEGYGATETSPVISSNVPELNRPGSVGKPLPNIEVRIENYDTGKECASGEVGKIMVKGDSIMKGYFDDLEESSLRLRSGWYDTGDMGYLDADGYLWHRGRLKRFVKIGGEMISLVSVEDALGKLLPSELEYCVVEIPDAAKGAKIVAVTSQEISKKEILNGLARHLPKLALPKQFIVLDELPKMSSGKVDFRATTEIVRQRLRGEVNAEFRQSAKA